MLPGMFVREVIQEGARLKGEVRLYRVVMAAAAGISHDPKGLAQCARGGWWVARSNPVVRAADRLTRVLSAINGW